VDSSSTIIVFINAESIIRKYNVITKKLLVPRLLRLVNSILTLLIIDYFTTWILIGLYTKAMLFFVTKLLPTTLIILGMPWL
jgi:hypothetical protein